MAEIPKERLEGEIQFLSGNQARIALEQIRTGKTLGEAIWLAKAFPQDVGDLRIYPIGGPIKVKV